MCRRVAPSTVRWPRNPPPCVIGCACCSRHLPWRRIRWLHIRGSLSPFVATHQRNPRDRALGRWGGAAGAVQLASPVTADYTRDYLPLERLNLGAYFVRSE